MKYRCLTDEELKELETEFKHFLITNHIYDEEWRKLNAGNDPKVMQLIEIFSDIVMDKALKNVRYLEHVTSTDIKAFQCNDKEMLMIGIAATTDTIDFTKHNLNDFKEHLSIFKTSKPYYKEREEEVFRLLESGCSIIDEARFKKLELAYTFSTQQIQN